MDGWLIKRIAVTEDGVRDRNKVEESQHNTQL